jgi:hypothetical protein
MKANGKTLDLRALATATAVLVSAAPDLFPSVQEALDAYQKAGFRLAKDNATAAIPYAAASHVLLSMHEYAAEGRPVSGLGNFVADEITAFFQRLQATVAVRNVRVSPNPEAN